MKDTALMKEFSRVKPEKPLGEGSALARQCHDWYQSLRAELAKAIVGQDEVIEQVLVSLLARGHAMLEGLPGLAKSLLMRSLAEASRLSFQRIQFSADLMPGDITGVKRDGIDGEPGSRPSESTSGCLFANLILADQIDQAPAKTQSAMFEAMQDRRIVVNGRIQVLPEPFFVLATHNPLENAERPLRDAQRDRFLLLIRMDYPSGAEEWEIARRAGSASQERIAARMSGDELCRFQEAVRQVGIGDRVLGYAWTLVRATRPTSPEAPDFVDRWIVCGAGPRGLVSLVTCAKARALLHGREEVEAGDIEHLATAALGHRIVLNPAAEANALTSDRLVRMVMESVPADGTYEPPPGVGLV